MNDAQTYAAESLPQPITVVQEAGAGYGVLVEDPHGDRYAIAPGGEILPAAYPGFVVDYVAVIDGAEEIATGGGCTAISVRRPAWDAAGFCLIITDNDAAAPGLWSGETVEDVAMTVMPASVPPVPNDPWDGGVMIAADITAHPLGWPHPAKVARFITDYGDAIAADVREGFGGVSVWDALQDIARTMDGDIAYPHLRFFGA